VSTRPGHGICFQSAGIMPPNHASLYNPVLAEFILALKPTRRARHQRLLLEILAANAELIAHWTKHVQINFKPRLHRDWLQAMELLQAVIEIALPQDTIEKSSCCSGISATGVMMPFPWNKIAVKALHNNDDQVKLVTCKILAAGLVRIIASRDPGIYRTTTRSMYTRCLLMQSCLIKSCAV